MTASAPVNASTRSRIAAWPPEVRALLHLLRVALRTAPAEEAFIWPADLAPAAFIACVDRHRVGPFLHHRLPAGIRTALPEAVQHRLAAVARLTARRALMRVGELTQIERLLADHGIPVTSVKGPLLARELYGEFGARHSGDLDLLIDLAHARRADALLRSAGYRRSQPDFELTPLQLRKYFTVRHEFEYFSADGSLRLEIMWRLVNHERFHRSTLGEPPDHVALAGRSMAVLPADTAALHLLLHGADHGWFRLFWLLDIALLMQGERLDWKRLLERAGTVQLDRVFWQSLLLARELLGVALPAGLPSPPCEPVIRRLVEDAFRHMELTPDEIKTGAAHLWMTFYHWRLQPSWRVRLRALRPRFVNPADWKTLRLPDRWFALYYVLWPLLWACRRFGSKSGKGQGFQGTAPVASNR